MEVRTIFSTIILTSVFAVACASSNQGTHATNSPLPLPATVAPIPSPTLAPSPISTITLSPAPTLPATATPTMPAYFKPHPALMALRDWEAKYGPIATNTRTPSPTPLPGLEQLPEFKDGIVEQIWSPDGSKVLVTSKVDKPTAPLILNGKVVLPVDAYRHRRQSWVVHANRVEMYSVFYTDWQFEWRWTDSRYLLVIGLCYGVDPIGEGLHIVDTQSLTMITIAASYNGNCEAGVPLSVSPDGKYMIFNAPRVSQAGSYNQAQVVEISTGKSLSVCADDEFARSYVWSSNSQYVYVACTVSREEPDQIYRYDTLVHDGANLTEQTQIKLKAREMWLSPDQSQLFFQWGENNFLLHEEYGIWVLDLNKLDE